MFSDKLSDSLLQFLGETDMSYEVATELCDLSAKTIGNIACRKSVASLTSLEKLCTGLGKSPNELLSNIDEQQATTYRFPMNVSNAKIFRSTFGFSAFPLCPRCATTLAREYQVYCDRCGQYLGWDSYRKTDEIDE